MTAESAGVERFEPGDKVYDTRHYYKDAPHRDGVLARTNERKNFCVRCRHGYALGTNGCAAGCTNGATSPCQSVGECCGMTTIIAEEQQRLRH